MSEEIKVTVVKYPDRDNLVLRYVDPFTGRQKTKSARTGNEREAQKAAGKWQAELREGRYHPAGKITWDEFRERYETEKLPSLAAGTAQRAAAVLNQVEEILRPKKLADVTADRLSHFQAKLRDKGLKEATIAGNLAHLRSALSWARKVKLLHAVPEIAMPKRAKGKTLMRGRPITAEEFDRLIAAVPKVRESDPDNWTRYLAGLWLSGLRLAESLKLSWDIEGELSVDLTGKHPRMRIWAEAEKGHQDRLLPITPDFAEWLLKTPEADRQGLVFSLPGLISGEPITAKRISRVISAIGEKAGVVVNKADGKFASAHDLRRAFATRWSSKVKPATLQLLMRHESIETTLKYYVAQAADDIAAELWGQHAQGNKSGNTGQNAAAVTMDTSAATPSSEASL